MDGPLPSRELSLVAPAKLNLCLSVVGKRADGFHDLDTLMVKLSLADRLTFRATEQPAIELQLVGCPNRVGPRLKLPVDERNLVVRAARLLNQKAGTSFGAVIQLDKQIPAEAGLGGGSSDGAMTLVALNRLWGLGYSTAELMDFAAELGSDLSFFLSPLGAAVCQGRGERVTPVRLSGPLHFVLVRPGSGLSTPAVFQRCKPSGLVDRSLRLVNAINRGAQREAASLMENDLTAPGRELNSEVADILDELKSLPLLGRQMTGSGSTCFGWCASWRQAMHVAGRLRRTGRRDVWVVKTVG